MYVINNKINYENKMNTQAEYKPEVYYLVNPNLNYDTKV